MTAFWWVSYHMPDFTTVRNLKNYWNWPKSIWLGNRKQDFWNLWDRELSTSQMAQVVLASYQNDVGTSKHSASAHRRWFSISHTGSQLWFPSSMFHLPWQLINFINAQAHVKPSGQYLPAVSWIRAQFHVRKMQNVKIICWSPNFNSPWKQLTC